MRRWLAALAAVCFISSPAIANGAGKNVVIMRGFAGEVLSPMTDLAAKLRQRGYRVRLTSSIGDVGNADIGIGHSLSCFKLLASKIKKIVTIDCPVWAHLALPRAPRGSRVYNFYTPFHPKISGAVNVPISGGHVRAPSTAQGAILRLL